MFVLLLIVVFALVFFSFAFIIQIVHSCRDNLPFNGLPHAIIVSACITFLVAYYQLM